MVQAILNADDKNGRVVRPWLGVLVQPVTQDIAESQGMDVPHGVLIREIYPASPATRAGMRMGDIILSIDGNMVDDTKAFEYRLAIAPLNAEVPFVIMRDGKKKILQVKLRPPPENPPRDIRKLRGEHPLNGYSVANLSPALAAELNLPLAREGVVILKSAPAGRSVMGFGLRAGDILLEVNGNKISSTKQLAELMNSGGHSWTITFDRGGQIMSMAVRQ